MEKEEIRVRVGLLRKGMRKEEVDEKSQDISDRLCSLPQFNEADTIMFYSTIENEVDLSSVVNYALSKGKTVVFPRVNGNHLSLARISNINELERGYLDILEPKKHCEEVSPDEINLFLVPGVAFDLQGNRIGHGKGFYDRLLKGNYSLKIGVAYELQIVKKIKPMDYDISMDFLVTENGVSVC